MRRALLVAVLTSILARALAAWPHPSGSVETRLVLIGGGPPPAEALARLVRWAGGPDARLLVVSWAARDPVAACEREIATLRAAGAGTVLCAPFPAEDAQGRAQPLPPTPAAVFRAQLARASGLFFTGGEQGRLMDVLADVEVRDALRSRYSEGVVFAGTSAGTAIMSPLAITGASDPGVIDASKVAVREGLALLPGVILDQHFVRRQRENRLFGLVLRHPHVRGVGIDEGTALIVTGGRYGEVVGTGLVVLVDAKDEDRLEVTLRRSGQRVNLRRLF